MALFIIIVAIETVNNQQLIQSSYVEVYILLLMLVVRTKPKREVLRATKWPISGCPAVPLAS
jgi:hypothetical protein